MRRTLLAPRNGGRSTSLRRLLPAAAIGAALALSACQTQSPIQTDVTYDPADGVPVDLGAVQLRDLVVISSGKGEAGVLSAAASNSGSSSTRIAFALASGSPVYAEVPAGSQERLSGSTQVQLPSMPVAPGDVVKLTVQSPSAPAAVVDVPVLPPTDHYATMSPTTSPTTSTSTSSPSSSTSTTASPTTSATS
jgi:hypothetical protein